MLDNSTLNDIILKELLNQTETVFFLCNDVGVILNWNEGAEGLLGWKEQEVLQLGLFTFFSNKDEITNALQRVKLQTKYFIETWATRKDGTKFWGKIGFSQVQRSNTNFYLISISNKTDSKISEQKYTNLLTGIDCLQDYAIFLLDKLGRITSWNQGAQRITGYSQSEIIGKHFSIFYPEEAKKSSFPEYELKVAAKDGRFEDESWRIRQDGKRFWANVIITAIFVNNEHVGYVKVTRDLTERRRAEEKLIALEQGINSIQDYAVIMLDLNGYIIKWNKGAERIKGYKAEEIIGKHFSIFYPEEAVQKNFPNYALSIVKRLGKYDDENWRVRKDGNKFWANVNISAVINDQKEHIGYIKVTRDLTEKKHTIEELSNMNKLLETKIRQIESVTHRLNLALSAGQMGIWNWNIATNQIELDNYMKSLIGGAPNTINELVEMVEISDRDRTCNELIRASKSAEQIDIEFKINKNGSLSSIETRALLHNDNMITAISWDVTNRRLEEERINELKRVEREQSYKIKVAEQYQRNQSEFMDRICHEIRNPLHGIQGSVCMIAEQLVKLEEKSIHDDEMMDITREIDKLLQSINECAQHQQEVTDEALSVSKLESMEIIPVPNDINPYHLIQSVIRMFKGKFEQKGLESIIEMKSGQENRNVYINSQSLKLILINLISNAVKYTDKGTITIQAQIIDPEPGSFSVSSSTLVITVSDTGRGLTELQRSKLFDRYGSHTTGYNYYDGSSGFGLIICKKIVDALNGTIEVDSNLGIGTTFIISLPFNPSTMSTTSSSIIHQPFQVPNVPTSMMMMDDHSSSMKNMKALIVDDNIINQKVLSSMLSKKGILYDIASNGSEAVDKVLSLNKYDVILMDIEMPVMNGLEASRIIKSKGISTPIIGLSGFAQDKDIKLGLESGFCDYLTKPFTKEKLYDVIYKHFHNKPH